LRLSRSQDIGEEMATEHDDSRSVEQMNRHVEPELQVTVDTVAEPALDENEGVIHFNGNSGEAQGESCNEEEQRLGNSRVLREAWPSSPTGAEVHGAEASRMDPGDRASVATVLPRAETATLDDTPDFECPRVVEDGEAITGVASSLSQQLQRESSSIPEPAERSEMVGRLEARASLESRAMSQLVALYEVYLRCTLQV
jgi:hypothetical protein